MKKVIRAKEEELVDVLVKTTDGQWRPVFEQIPESQAIDIWRAGFATGKNVFSIETAESRRVAEINRRFLSGLGSRY